MHPIRASLTVGLLMLLSLTSVGPAAAGGPTSALLSVPGEGRTASLYYTDPEYDALADLVGIESDTGLGTVDRSGRDHASGPGITVTWMIHDVMPWRIDRIYPNGEGAPWIATQIGVGNAPIGGAIGDTPIIVRGNGVPVKAVGLMGGGALTVVVGRKDRGIEKLEDLRGKKISVLAFQDTTYYALLGALASKNITKNDVDAQAVGPASVASLVVAGTVDACACTPDWEINVKDGVKDTVSLPTKDYFQSMSQAILTSDKMIAERPEMVGGTAARKMNVPQMTILSANGSRIRPSCVICPYRRAQKPSTQSVPQRIAASRATIRALTFCDSGTRAAVTSPQPRSSASAAATCRAMGNASSSGRAPCAIRSASVGPSTSSRTSANVCGSGPSRPSCPSSP